MRKFVYCGEAYDVDDILCGLALLGYVPKTDTDSDIMNILIRISSEEELTLLNLLN